MKEISYKAFSLRTHKKNWHLKIPNICQFELTFGCELHCKHCYTDCYNKTTYIKRELDTKEVKSILDKVYDFGALWLCFTGGDPLTRKDFLDIYSYAKNKGFIITIFTNGYSMTEEMAAYLKKRPPFVIEMTLNAVTKSLYEKTSQVKDSFDKVIEGISLILEAKLPLKIKTQITQDNLKELPRIKKFIKGLGLKFRPSVFLHARLNGDPVPCNLRISLGDVLSLDGKKPLLDDVCSSSSRGRLPNTEKRKPNINLFRCAAGKGDGIYIDPYGNIIPCNCLREPKVNLLKENMDEAQKEILNWVRTRYFTHDSKCINCSVRYSCYNCPGKALLEEGNLGGVADWYCELAHLVTGQMRT